jgi:hypothetical protein
MMAMVRVDRINMTLNDDEFEGRGAGHKSP